MLDLDNDNFRSLAMEEIDEGPLYRALVYGADDPESESRQLEESFEKDYEANEALRYPFEFSPDVFVQSIQISTRLGVMARLMARMIAGLGWYVAPKRKTARLDPEVLRTVTTTTERLRHINRRSLEKPARFTLTEILESAVLDRETAGNGYIEVSDTVGGLFGSMHYLPTAGVRYLASGDGFLQKVFDAQGLIKKVYFKRWGDPRDMDFETGKMHKPGSLPRDQRATSVIHLRVHCPGSPHYGLPRWAAASPGIALRRQKDVWNFQLTLNATLWPVTVIAEECELDDGSANLIKNMTEKKGKGLRGAGKVVILQPKKNAAGRPGGRIRLDASGQTARLDGSFTEVGKQADDDLREAFGPDALYLGGATGAGRAHASVARMLSSEVHYVPEQVALEELMNTHVIPYLDDTGEVEWRCKRPETTDPIQKAIMLNKLDASSILSFDQMVAVINSFFPEFEFEPWGEPWSQVPTKVLDLVSSAGAGQAQAAARGLLDQLAGFLAKGAPSSKSATPALPRPYAEANPGL